MIHDDHEKPKNFYKVLMLYLLSALRLAPKNLIGIVFILLYFYQLFHYVAIFHKCNKQIYVVEYFREF